MSFQPWPQTCLHPSAGHPTVLFAESRKTPKAGRWDIGRLWGQFSHQLSLGPLPLLGGRRARVGPRLSPGKEQLASSTRKEWDWMRSSLQPHATFLSIPKLPHLTRLPVVYKDSESGQAVSSRPWLGHSPVAESQEWKPGFSLQEQVLSWRGRDGGLSSASSRAVKSEGHFPFNVILVQVPCSAASQKIHRPLPVTPGSDAPSKCSPQRTGHPVTPEWQIPGPHTRTTASESLGWGTPWNLPWDFLWGNKPIHVGEAPRAESSWQVPQLVRLQEECFGRKRVLGAGSPPSWYKEEVDRQPGVLSPPGTSGSHADTSVPKSSGSSSPQWGEAEGPVS